MLRLHLTVLTTRNETWRLWKRISKFLSLLFMNYISRNLDNTKILLYKFFIRYLVVKPACVNAAQGTEPELLLARSFQIMSIFW